MDPVQSEQNHYFEAGSSPKSRDPRRFQAVPWMPDSVRAALPDHTEKSFAMLLHRAALCFVSREKARSAVARQMFGLERRAVERHPFHLARPPWTTGIE